MRLALFDAAGVAGMAVIRLVLTLAAGKGHFFGIDDDYVVAAVDMRCEQRLVLSAKPSGDQSRQAPDDEAVGVDQHPFLAHLGRPSGIGFHVNGPVFLCR